MKVKKAIALLRTYDPDLEIYLSRDEEGNGFKPLYEMDDVALNDILEWGNTGEVGVGKRVLVLWP